jgi:hypothetical protein
MPEDPNKKEENKEEGKKESSDFTDASKLEGKTTKELAEMYVNLGKELGKNSKEVSESREQIKQMNIVLAALEGEPEMQEKLKAKIDKMQNPDKYKDKKDDDKPDPKTQVIEADLDDSRKVLEANIIREFEQTYGLDALDPEKKKEMNTRIGTELWELADPSGKYKTYQEVIKNTPLNKLAKMLDKAYLLANKDKLFKDKEFSGQGRATSSSHSEERFDLTPEERHIAERQGIAPEKYLARKKEILSKK